MTETARLTNIQDIRNYVFAGQSIFTIVSARTGARFTYRVKLVQTTDGPIYWICILNGPDNEADYDFIGTIYQHYKTGRWNLKISGRAHLPYDAPSVRAAQFFVARLNVDRDLDGRLQFWHSGHCARCGKRLTTPESVERGLGPVCAEKMR